MKEAPISDSVMEQEVGEIEFAPAPPANYKVGDHVVYPHHGAAVIEKKEKRTVFGEEKEYFVLRMAHGDMTLAVPIDSSERRASISRAYCRASGSCSVVRRCAWTSRVPCLEQEHVES